MKTRELRAGGSEGNIFYFLLNKTLSIANLIIKIYGSQAERPSLGGAKYRNLFPFSFLYMPI
jgi:hypothetical protein